MILFETVHFVLGSGTSWCVQDALLLSWQMRAIVWLFFWQVFQVLPELTPPQKSKGLLETSVLVRKYKYKDIAVCLSIFYRFVCLTIWSDMATIRISLEYLNFFWHIGNFLVSPLRWFFWAVILNPDLWLFKFYFELDAASSSSS